MYKKIFFLFKSKKYDDLRKKILNQDENLKMSTSSCKKSETYFKNIRVHKINALLSWLAKRLVQSLIDIT